MNGKQNQPLLKLNSIIQKTYVIMAIPQVSKTLCDETDVIIARFDKLAKPIVFNENTSLAILKAKNEQCKDIIDARNTAAEHLDACIIAVNNAEKELSKIRSSFMFQAGDVYGRNSDEFVWAGGIRQSEVIEKQKAKRQENQKIEADKNKKE